RITATLARLHRRNRHLIIPSNDRVWQRSLVKRVERRPVGHVKALVPAVDDSECEVSSFGKSRFRSYPSCRHRGPFLVRHQKPAASRSEPCQMLADQLAAAKIVLTDDGTV